MISPLLCLPNLFLSLTLIATTFAALNTTTATPAFAGYLISTFSDANPTVQFYLSKGNDAGSFGFANKGRPVLTSTVGTRAVRDVFLTTNAERSVWYMIGTGELLRMGK